MKKKIVAVTMATMLAVALPACSKKEENTPVVEDLSKVTLADIEKANAGETLVDKYKSVAYKMEIRDTDKYTEEAAIAKKDGKYCYTVTLEDSEAYRTETFKDGYMYSEYGNTNGVEHSVCWFMDGEYDAYLNSCVENFIVGTTDDQKITEIITEKDYVSVTAQVDEGDNVSAEYDFYCEYVMDKTTLEVNQFLAYMVSSGETSTDDKSSTEEEGEMSISTFAEVTYDEEYKEPSYVKKLQDEEKRTVTLIVDPGTDSEKSHKIEIAGTAIFDAVLADGYELYSDAKGNTVYEIGSELPETDGTYSDMTVYAMKQ